MGVVMFIVLFGAPGVGKGTQAVLIAERASVAHLSTGDEFRRNIREQTELGLQVKSIVESGQLVPDELVTAIVADALAQPKYAMGCIFDGFPRTLGQASDLDALLAGNDNSIDLVVNIEVAQDEIVQRMLNRGRADDTEAVIRDRLGVYERETAPVLDYYRAQGRLQTVDGNSDVETVYARIAALLTNIG